MQPRSVLTNQLVNMPPRKSTATHSTRDAVFQAAATLFSARGFDGVGVDDIARTAGVNKAMIYYHFADKLALYRAVVAEMLQDLGGTVAAIAASDEPPPRKLDRFIEVFVRMTETRPWFPAVMLREISEGAPHLDVDTLVHMRTIVMAFAGILAQGQNAGLFRQVHPILAYTSVVGPLVFNAARERVGAQPGRQRRDLPMLVEIPHAEVVAHAQETARRMLTP
jgi:AcrR family transcriptional regulator